jgi:hypothetical protein
MPERKIAVGFVIGGAVVVAWGLIMLGRIAFGG